MKSEINYAVFWSTLPPEALPKVGDTVCLAYGVPLTVTRRIRNEFGNVMLSVQAPDGTETITMVEACHWWPIVGDLGTGIPGIYQRWLTAHWEDAKAADDKATLKKIEKAFYAYDNPSSWLYQDFTVDRIQGDLATVSGQRFHGSHAIPLAAIAVLSRPSLDAVLELAA